ncbi:MAG: hypothetical protein J6L72_00075, partial [Butyricicoccus sp.]|nr:hypothetical protein [Butyricicoccus sp.]
MKRILLAALLAALCLYGAGAAAASAALTIPKQVYTQAEADMAKLPGAHAGLRVTRLSVYPWYEDGSAYSIFIEVENISEEKIAWDDDGLVALDVYGGEMARGYGLLEGTTALVQPGERMILMAGASTRRVGVYDDGGAVMGFREVEGLGAALIISPRCTISFLRRFIIRSICLNSLASKSPIIRSASLMA